MLCDGWMMWLNLKQCGIFREMRLGLQSNALVEVCVILISGRQSWKVSTCLRRLLVLTWKPGSLHVGFSLNSSFERQSNYDRKWQVFLSLTPIFSFNEFYLFSNYFFYILYILTGCVYAKDLVIMGTSFCYKQPFQLRHLPFPFC